MKKTITVECKQYMIKVDAVGKFIRLKMFAMLLVNNPFQFQFS